MLQAMPKYCLKMVYGTQFYIPFFTCYYLMVAHLLTKVDMLPDSLLKGWVSIVIISTTVHSGMNKYIPRMRNETAKGG